MKQRLAICGYGEAGKDTVGRWINANTEMCCRQSTSEAAADVVFKEWGHRFYATAREAWLDRRNHRKTWAEIIWRHNQPDGLTLYREMVNDGIDVLVGIRCKEELQACVTAGLVELSIWVDRPGYEESKDSMTLTKEDCDVVVVNDGSIEELHAKVKALVGT